MIGSCFLVYKTTPLPAERGLDLVERIEERADVDGLLSGLAAPAAGGGFRLLSLQGGVSILSHQPNGLPKLFFSYRTVARSGAEVSHPALGLGTVHLRIPSV